MEHKSTKYWLPLQRAYVFDAYRFGFSFAESGRQIGISSQRARVLGRMGWRKYYRERNDIRNKVRRYIFERIMEDQEFRKRWTHEYVEVPHV